MQERAADPNASYAPIRDYALIGDCRTAALVSRAGSIDFLCLPRFDGEAVFAALLDAGRGGRFFVRPVGDFSVRRRYVGASNVLETTFETPSGVVRLTDSMSVAEPADERGALLPHHEILRCVECLSGRCEIEVGCDPRLDWGAHVPRRRDRGPFGFTWDLGNQLLTLRTEIPVTATPAPTAPQGAQGVAGRATLAAGDRRFLSLSTARGEPAVFPELGDAAAGRLGRTVAWWHRWAAACTYQGPHADAVLRSLLTLKLLTYAPSGAVIASPTTSLPEEIGGVRNWDYRYCWLRDASWTLTSFFDLGYRDEGESFFSWLLYATRMRTANPSGGPWLARLRGLRVLNVVYDVHGEVRLGEREIPWLEGYAGSRPVRVGNGALHQLQLDIFGEVVLAAYEYVERGGTLDRSEGRLLGQLGDTVRALWRQPDEGIWEKRAGRFQHTYSKAMCWVALDRLLRLHERGLVDIPAADFAADRDALRDAIESAGWSAARNTYVDVLGGDGLDASLLLLGLRGYDEPATSPRLQATLAALRAGLERNGMLYRYPPGDDGLPGGEAAFGICTFWLSEFLARCGNAPEALAVFERTLANANDVGLFGEEIDPATGEARGNFPQAFTHVGLISAALAITAALSPPTPSTAHHEAAHA